MNKNIVVTMALFSSLLTGCSRQSEAVPQHQPDAQAREELKHQPDAQARENPLAAKKVPVKPPVVVAVTREEKEQPAGEKKAEPPPVSPPADKGEKLLQNLLGPRKKNNPFGSAGPRKFPPTGYLDRPEVPLPVYKGLPARPTMKTAGKTKSPGDLAAGVPLSHLPFEFIGPKIHLPAGPLALVPSAGLDQPAPVPLLSQHRPDRASLADPTVEASLAAALDAAMPMRQNPAPYLPANLPDPFENRKVIRLREEVPENPEPVVDEPRIAVK